MPAERTGTAESEDSSSTQTVSSLNTPNLETTLPTDSVPDVGESSVVQLTVQDLEDLEKIQAELDSLTSNLPTTGNSVAAVVNDAPKPSPVKAVAKTVWPPVVENKTHIISVKSTDNSSKQTCSKTTKPIGLVPVTVVSTVGESHVPSSSAYTIVAVSTNSMIKMGKQVLLVQKPTVGTSSLRSGGTTLVSTVTPLCSASVGASRTITIPQTVAGTVAVPVKGNDVKVIVPQQLPTTIMSVPQIGGNLINNLNLLQGKRVITTVGGNQQILNKFKVVSSTGNAQLGNVTLTAAGSTTGPDGTIQPTILLASPTKAFTVARTPTKQNVVLLSPVKAKLGTMATAMKSPLRIAPAPNTVETNSKLANSTAAGAVGTSADATKPTPSLSTQPPRLILRPLVPQQATVKAVTCTTLTTQTSMTTTTATIKQVMVPVSSVLNPGTTPVQQIQVPGSKFSYVRLVSAPVSQAGSANTTVKQATLVPVSSIRPVTTTTASISSGQVRLAVPIAPVGVQNQATRMVGIKPQQRLLIPSNATLTQIRPDSATIGQFPAGSLPVLSTGGGVPSFFMVQLQQSQGGAAPRMVLHPAQTAQSILPAGGTSLPPSAFVPIAAANAGCITRQFDNQQIRSASIQMHHTTASKHVNGSELEGADTRPRKPCNCTKSQCLKLYCDCFANGEFCNNCNCNNCSNNLEHEEERQKAIKSCLDRNPQAFHPKIGKTCKGKDGDHERRHTKGCNCKRSGCLKNYCECYEAKILCTSLCKCVGCKNFEDSSERKTLMHLADAAEVRVLQQATARTKISSQLQDMPTRAPILSSTGERLPFAFVTQEVVEATCQCLLARAEEGERSRYSVTYLERLILEEFGRCLMQIIECANKTKGSS